MNISGEKETRSKRGGNVKVTKRKVRISKATIPGKVVKMPSWAAECKYRFQWACLKALENSNESIEWDKFAFVQQLRKDNESTLQETLPPRTLLVRQLPSFGRALSTQQHHRTNLQLISNSFERKDEQPPHKLSLKVW